MEKNTWIPVTSAEIPGWTTEMTINTIEKITNGQTKVLQVYGNNGSCGLSDRNSRNLWYSESRDFLIKNGVIPVNEIAESGKDACMYDKLFWDENLYQIQNGFYGSISPVLLVKGLDNEITLWAINTVENLSFRGSAFVKNLPKYIQKVRMMYKGIITEDKLNLFLCGIPPQVRIEHKFEPLPTADFLKNQIIQRKIDRWDIHKCGICGYQCGFLFRVNNNKLAVMYDRGCNCIYQPPRPDNIDNVIKHMEIQSNIECINKYKIFWGII